MLTNMLLLARREVERTRGLYSDKDKELALLRQQAREAEAKARALEDEANQLAQRSQRLNEQARVHYGGMSCSSSHPIILQCTADLQ